MHGLMDIVKMWVGSLQDLFPVKSMFSFGEAIPCGTVLTLCETHNTDTLFAYSALSNSSSRFPTRGCARNFMI